MSPPERMPQGARLRCFGAHDTRTWGMGTLPGELDSACSGRGEYLSGPGWLAVVLCRCDRVAAQPQGAASSAGIDGTAGGVWLAGNTRIVCFDCPEFSHSGQGFTDCSEAGTTLTSNRTRRVTAHAFNCRRRGHRTAHAVQRMTSTKSRAPYRESRGVPLRKSSLNSQCRLTPERHHLLALGGSRAFWDGGHLQRPKC